MLARAGQGGLIAGPAEVAVDATGLDSRHASRHYVHRTGGRRFAKLSWPKLTVACHTGSHLLVAATVSRGPSQDSPQFRPVVRQARRRVRLRRVLGDAAYDAEHNHRVCRERLGADSYFRLNPRNAGRKWPRTPYRRSMKRGFPTAAYNQRWQVESAFSRHKRLLGPFLRARSLRTQRAECLLRVLTHNLMLVAALR